jgi:hypothetical protein
MSRFNLGDEIWDKTLKKVGKIVEIDTDYRIDYGDECFCVEFWDEEIILLEIYDTPLYNVLIEEDK